jgi:hypothetical protein
MHTDKLLFDYKVDSEKQVFYLNVIPMKLQTIVDSKSTPSQFNIYLP